jgi:NAD+ synthase (glutamine-hydrolysing)
MRLIKIGLASLNPTVGRFQGNLDVALAAAKRLTYEQCTVICLPEQSLSGYTGEDYVHWQGFVDEQWKALRDFAAISYNFGGVRPVYVVGLTVSYNGSLYNCAAVVCDGRILGVVPKEKLPTYGVFYERRTTSPGFVGMHGTVGSMHPNASNDLQPIPFGDLIFEFPFGVMAVEICEDIWSPRGPMTRRCFSGAELVVNISASPFRAGVVKTREEMISTRAADNCATLVYVNQFGGNDALVYDGGGYVNQGGRMVLTAPRLCESFSTVVVDLDRTSRQRRENMTWRTDAGDFLREHQPVQRIVETRSPQTLGTHYRFPVPPTGPSGELPNFFVPASSRPADPQREYFQDLFDVQVVGLRDYFRKIGIFERVGIALSGGKDSTLSLLVAHRFATLHFSGLPAEEDRAAAIKDFIHCISFPTEFNSKEGRDAARELCAKLGVTYMEAPITEQVASMDTLMEATLGPSGSVSRVAKQNVQARIRGTAMLNWSNCNAGLMMYTGNMTEKALGWTTIGGDLEGGFGVLGNLPRTVQIPMLRYLNEEYYHLPELAQIIESPPTPELEKGQDSERETMPFPISDACYYLFASEKMMPAEVLVVLRQMFTPEQLEKMYPGYQPAMLAGWVRKFVAMFRGAIFKWDQSAKSVHLGGLDLDVKRALQLPVATSGEWLRLKTLEADAAKLESV